MSVSFIRNSNGTYNVVLSGKPFVVNRDHEFYGQIEKELHGKRDEPTLLAWLSVSKAVTAYSNGRVKVDGDTVTLDGKVITGKIVDRILELVRKNYDAVYLTKFLERVKLNPSFRAANEAFNFLEHKGFPLTEDGCFLGYKSVRRDYKDHHSGTFSNVVGAVIQVPRNEVDEDSRKDCSNGLHVGTLEYALGFHSGSQRIMIVKVDPADVVSVPEYDTNKLRTCKYEVISEYADTSKHLNEGVYAANGLDYVAPDYDDYDDYEDEDENDNYTRLSLLEEGDEFTFADFDEEAENVYRVVFIDSRQIVIEDMDSGKRSTYSVDCNHRVLTY